MVSTFIDEATVRQHAEIARSIGVDGAWRRLHDFVYQCGGHEGDAASASVDFKALVHELKLGGVVFPDEEGALGWTPFPVSELPAALRDYVLAHAHAIGCDEALVAMPCLAALAASIGNTACIALGYGWNEPSTLWTCVVAPSGSAKSPAQNAALRPTMELERQAAAVHRRARKDYEAEVAAAHAARKGAAQEPLPKPPKQVRYRMGDVTTETLQLVHADNQRGLLLVRDELGGWMGGFDRYAKSGKGDAQTWIEMHGSVPTVIDRKSNSENPVMYLDRPAVSITGGIQPGILARLLRSEHFDSGFAARLLMVWPPARTLEWRRTTRGAVAEVEKAYRHVIVSLYALPFQEEDGACKPVEIPLSDRAVEAFQRFYRFATGKTGRLPEMSPLRSVWSKAPAVCARLALGIELAERASEASPGTLVLDTQTTIRAHSVERAAQLTRWFLRESLRIYRRLEFGTQGVSGEEARIRQLPETFTRDDVQRVWGFKDASSASKKLKGLVQAAKVSKLGHGSYHRPAEGDELTGSLTDLELLSDVPPLPSRFLAAPSGDGLAEAFPSL